jgi:hypothetical protein
MTRMALNGRIYQYGFIQASLGTLVVVALLIQELPMTLKFRGLSLSLMRLGFGAMLLCGITSIMEQSKNLENAKTLAVGHGKDLFKSFPSPISGDGEMVSFFSEKLTKTPENQTLIVVPEGIMINYLARMQSPVGVQAFYTIKEAEKNIVHDLELHAPNWVVFMSRDLTEYGITKFGSNGQSGELIINFLTRKYEVCESYGRDPLYGNGIGGKLYKLSH